MEVKLMYENVYRGHSVLLNGFQVKQIVYSRRKLNNIFSFAVFNITCILIQTFAVF